MDHNADLRKLLDRHLTSWTVVDRSEEMEVHGWLRANGVQVRISGLRVHVVETLTGLIAVLVSTERLPPA